MKTELVHTRSWPTRQAARTAIYEYLEVFYNRRRRHSALGYLSPTEYERRYHQQHPATLVFGEDGDRYVVVASKGGAPRHPDWYLNLTDDPEVEVQVKADRFGARARTAQGAERERLWGLMAGIWPAYDQYQRRTDRLIPVVILERAA